MANKYGSKEELIYVASLIRKCMFDYIMGTIDKKEFLKFYYEFEGFLNEHEYADHNDKYFEMDLPDAKKFLKENLAVQYLPLEIGNTYETKFATKEKFLLKNIVKNDKGVITSLEGIYINRAHLGICPIGADRLVQTIKK